MTVVVFSVNREHVGTSQDFRKITWHVGVEQGRIWSSVVPFSTAYTWMILLKRRARERGHYRGFACGYPWRGETSRGGERRPPCVGTRVSPCTGRPKAVRARCPNRRRHPLPR
ncbi:hypothetical protein HZH66_005229 [Vespula vulgaris]|uniref:Uncharacterized protein n=1 Tax=Vespula vulgaris TaxID=7454 RepID=A0A834NBA0_VESVU|nr:hypothetical protein HZH66_005229 [Vespula vulgaris]